MCGTENHAHHHGEHHHLEEASAGSVVNDSPAEPGAPAGPELAGPNSGAYGLEGLDCGHCVETVEKAVAAVPGVESATVDLVPDGVSRLTVSGTADEAALREVVLAAGYSFSR